MRGAFVSVPADRLAAVAHALLDASTLCAIATVTQDAAPYVNTAYFAWLRDLRVVWLSHPDATHSRNIGARGEAAVAVYDSHQVWGRPDRGIQLFGTAAEAPETEDAYADRFPELRVRALTTYRFYALRPTRVKLFDEPELGPGTFVVASCAPDGRLTWEATEAY
jgi:uncharacterized protein YhbP (UPF0306 family)